MLFFIRKRAYTYNIPFDWRILCYKQVDMMNLPKIIVKRAKLLFIKKHDYTYNIQFNKRIFFYKPLDMMKFHKYYF